MIYSPPPPPLSNANDDLGNFVYPDYLLSSRFLPTPNPQKLNKTVIAAMPVHGRHKLVHHTITRLLTKNRCSMVVCTGNEFDRQVCEDAGAIFVPFSNRYLGEKWNAAFLKARQYSPDAVLFVGSSDWLSDNWLDTMLPCTDEYPLVGKAGCYFLDVMGDRKYKSYSGPPKPYPIEYKLVYWPGYKYGSVDKVTRANESIGIGRLLSAKGLDKINWKPFHDQLNGSLDRNMYKKFLPSEHKMMFNASIKALSISTSQWGNKHKFSDHWNGICPSKRILTPDDFCRQYFPEYNKIV